MNARDLKEKFVNFFISKQHIEIPSASIVPENDPSTLFISAGMHPLVPYLLGQPHPLGKRLVDVQKCVRTGDIDEVGDCTHHTFFEMLGNWSLGDYFKKEAIEWSYEFLIKHLKLDLDRFSVTCFIGDQNSPKDEESSKIWQSLGVTNIKFLPKKDNWWGPAGTTGPCGPDTEMFIDGIEIWNDVFMQYYKDNSGNYLNSSQINVDTGMGVERTVAILSGFNDNYMSSVWQPIIKKIEELSGVSYVETHRVRLNQSQNINNNQPNINRDAYNASLQTQKSIRIIADHIRSAVFIIADGVDPSNKDRGYVLRRLIRRAIRQGKLLGIDKNFTSEVAQAVLDNQNNYAGEYPELNANIDRIFSVLDAEEIKFRKTLEQGLREIQKLIDRQISKNTEISGSDAFKLYESFGFPLEMITEELSKNNLNLNIDDFNKAKVEHQKLSQTLSAGKFKSGLADDSEIITKYHTTTHLLHTALRKILGDHVQQSGSNITSERLRFDFSHSEKLTEDELKQVEDLINQKISENLPVVMETMKYTDAIKSGALAFFGSKYPEIVSVYTAGLGDNYFSKEVCTGPHVENTGKIGKIKITKEESAGSGKRRIYAVIENP